MPYTVKARFDRGRSGNLIAFVMGPDDTKVAVLRVKNRR